MAKRKKKHEEEGGEAWLLPYSDLMTLLLAVFIVLFAVSKIDQGRAAGMAQAFSKQMMVPEVGVFEKKGDSVMPGFNVNNKTEAPPTPAPTTQKPGETKNPADQMTDKELQEYLGKQEMDSLEGLKDKLDQMFEENNILGEITTNIDSRGLVISLNDAILFDPGKADIKSDNKKTLIKVGETINQLSNYIRVEGHSDNTPISSEIYPSNWELSAARASRVVRLFVDKCETDPKKLVAVAYAEYKPVASNKTALGRAKNRRIDIIVLSGRYNYLETQGKN